MALRKSQVLLPDVFQTVKNNKFLNATVDQLISEPNLQRVNSFIGRKFAPNFTVGDSYVQEIDTDRQNYQLEPAVVYRTPNKQIESLTGYVDFVNQLRYNNVNVNTHSDLFDQEYYNYSGFTDLDKLVNYGEYFWLPDGPDSVQVFNSIVDTEKAFTITRRTVAAVDEYSIDGSDNSNPTITVARGGSYTFNVQQTGTPFWIQTEIGISGISNYGSNVSTREILGVTNNGDDNGTITFNVPETDAQNDKINATQAANPDFATTLTYKQIHNVPYQTLIDTHGGIDVQTKIDGKSLVFVNLTTDETAWDAGAPFDGYGFDDPNNPFDETTTLAIETRYDVYNISVNNVGGVDTVQLTRSTDWPAAQKVKIKQGNDYGNREFYKDASGLPELIQPYTAGLDILYYQDGVNATQFGKIQIVDVNVVPAIDVSDDILGKQTFASANSVKFTNGLKVEFNSDVTPSTYANREYFVEGVGQPGGITLTPVDEMLTPETYTNSTSDGFDTVAYDAGGWDGTLNAPIDQDYIVINRSSVDKNAWSRGNRWFHREVIEATATYNNYTADIDDAARAKRPIIEFHSGLELFNMGTSSVSPVTVVDTTQTDALSNVNGTLGYFADGIDLQQDNTIIFSADTDADVRLKIYRVDFIDQDSDAVTGKIINLVDVGTVVDGNCVLSTLGASNQGKQYWLNVTTWTAAQQKTKLNQDPLFDIFDPDHVSFSDTTKYPSSNFVGSKLFSYKRNNNANPDTVLNFGLTYKNFNTLGDIVFENNFDSDTFQYTKSTGNTNVIVRSGHAHQFDIAGKRVLYNGWTKTVQSSTQYQIVSYDVINELYSFEIGASVDTSKIRQPLQVFVNGKFKYPTEYTHLIQGDREYVVFTTALVENDTVTIKFVSNAKATNSFYEVPDNLERNAGNATFATLTLGQMRNHTVEISHQVKTLTGVAPGKSNIRDVNYRAYPGNILQHSAGMILPMYALTNKTANTIDSIKYVKNEYTKFKNKFIDNIDRLDLDLSNPSKCVDDILTHMAGKKTSSFPFYYSDMLSWGTQKSQVVYTIDDAAETEFEFNTQFDLTAISNQGVLVYHTPVSTGVDNLLVEGVDYTFDTVEAKLTLTATNLGVATIGLTVNDKITIVEYTETNGSFVPPTPTALGLYPKYSPSINMDATYVNTIPTGDGPFKIYGRDTQTDRSYYNQLGWYYPLFTTEAAAQDYDTTLGGSGAAHTHKFENVSGVFYMPNSSMNHATNNVDDFVEYTATKPVVQGHDGSLWVGWSDIRDNVLLELEKRIYNNIKTQYTKDLFNYAEVVPGYFRSTLADLSEANNITRSYYGEWALRNKVKTAPNTTVDPDNGFTWNYRNSVEKINKTRIPGYWRSIYRWFFDTDTPHTTPWEMLGISVKPIWWDERYGVAPYTQGNTVLWENLRDGMLYNDATGTTFTTDVKRQRPNLMSIIPVDAQGTLKPPADFLVEDARQTNADGDWVYSDGSPAETAWRRSSEYPFVLQILAATVKPAMYGTLMFDTNMYEKNAQYDQILQKNKSYRPSITDYQMHGQSSGNNDIVRVEGYNQFISEFIRFSGFGINDAITKINNLELNLCYSMAGFTDKKFLKVVAESVTPSSQSENIFIPDENLNIFTKKSLPLERVVYSGVQIIQRGDGYEIQGYDIENPFFKIVPSVSSNQPKEIRVGETVLFEYKDFDNKIINIPYGTVITSKQQVFDFLVAYQRYLLSRGFVFNGTTGAGDKVDFVSAGAEFAFWTEQKWVEGSVIVLSPYYDTLVVNRSFATVDDLTGGLKDANNAIINPRYYDISRTDNAVEIRIDTENTNLYSAQCDPIQHEHVLVFSNTTIFNDIIYQPELGNRHSRLKLIGTKSGDWNGTLHAPGFFINDDVINVWQQYEDYKKGDLVSFNNKTYVAKYNIDGSSIFKFDDWTLADNIQTGLVKNLANKAGQFKNFFELDNLNLEDGVDKLGKGIIGFNNKDYLQGLGLDDVSQVKFYQGMLKQKGTGAAINKLIDAELTNLDQSIDYFEEWAFRVGEYGSIDSNQIIETIIPEDQASNNPFVLHFHADGESTPSTIGHYHLQAKDLYKTPNNYTGDVFATRNANSLILNDLDSAGYARLDDVDFTVFNGDGLEALSSRIDELGKGKKIWVATDSTNTWGMRRIDETLSTVISVESATNGFLIYTTDRNHGLVVDDYVIVRAVQPIGRVAKVAGVPSPNKFVVADTTTNADIQDVRIPMYKLSSVRFAQPSDLSTYTPVSGWDSKELVWVDKDSDGDWQVLQNARPWSTTGVNTASPINADDDYGSGVAINSASTIALVGAPANGSGTVVPYVRSEGGILIEGNNISSQTIGDSLDSFGASLAIATDYAVIGAPDTESSKGAAFPYYIDSTGAFNRRPAIRPSALSTSDKFGFAMAMSGNGRYLFIGAPGDNKIYAYTLIDLITDEEKVSTLTGDGSTAGLALDFTPVNLNALNVVDENGKVYLPTKDFAVSSSTITFTSAPADNLQIVVRQMDYFREIGSYTAGSGDFGHSVDCDYTGKRVIVGAPNATISGKANSGEAYLYAQYAEKFIADGTIKAFTTTNTLQTRIYVEINGVVQIETNNDDVPTDNDGSTDGYYTRASKTITFKTTPTAGDIIQVYTGTFTQMQQIDQVDLDDETNGNEQFGISVGIDTKGSIIAIGSPGEDETNPNTGSVFILQDAGKNYASVTSKQGGSYSITSGHTLFINDREVTASSSSTDPADLAADIIAANIPGVSASKNSSDQLVIATTSTELYNKLSVMPGTGNSFQSGAIVDPFKFTQKINHPQAFENENFGEKVAFDKHVHSGSSAYSDTRNLVIASDKASTLLSTGFDIESSANSEYYLEATTTFDQSGTTFTDRRTQSGAVYAYELLNPNTPTLADPSMMVFGQQLKSTNIGELDKFGSAIVYNDNRIFVGAPNDTTNYANSGSVYEFNNNTRAGSWNVLRSEGTRVDVDRINRVALYNKKQGQVSLFLDYIDPAKGKIAGVASAELNYVSHSDPALYNNLWNYKYKNRLWWDTSTVHYLNAEQGNIDFRTNYWAQAFPGSSIDIYEWIESSTPPSQYTGEGTVKDVTQFNTASVYDSKTDSTQPRYYFWVKDITSVPNEAEFRTISADSVRSLIEDPKAAGLPHIAFLDTDAVALYNCKQYFADKDVVLSINYDVIKNEGVLHSEFELYGKGNTDQAIPTRMYTKLVDSLAGSDSVGNLVPDPFLSEVEKYGVLTQPRQGMFVNRAAALKVLAQYTNSVLVKSPFARNSSLTKLLSSENIPTVNSDEYDTSVDSVQERDFLNTAILSTGYKVLVLEDENRSNYWTIYTLQADKSWQLTNIQAYNTSDYWNYATYYAAGYNVTTVPKYQVTLETDLLTLTDSVTGDIAKVTSNDEGNFSMFAKTDAGWDEVIIERGTLQFNASLYSFATTNSNFEATGFDNDGFDFAAFDKVPAQEIRQIVSALKTDVFIGDYEINMNELFFRLMEYALNENNFSQDWLFKTSFITVAHKIRSLDQYNTFKFDNTNFIEDFINEVKPYKTKIREYVSKYDKIDTYGSDTTDFDLHAYYDEVLRYFRKPSGERSGDEILQTQGLNKPWSENYGYTLDSIQIVNAGTGYITDPTVTISAPQLAGGVQAVADAKTNGDTIISITMTNKGSGYTQEPTITVTGSGTGILVSPRIVNNTVRSFDTTLKFDRITYTSSVKDWAATTAYTAGDIIAYQNTVAGTQEVYDCVLSFTSGVTFSVENASGNTVLTVKPDAEFTNTADRIAAYYYPISGMIGDDLELLQKGTGYLGNKVDGPNFDQDPGFDSANFDVIGFDNFEIDSDGLSVLAGLDTIFRGIDFGSPGYEGDEFVATGYAALGYIQEVDLGIDPISIQVDGAGFVDTYNSHAPEELIPGRVYDTLDMEVYTHASNDYEKDGNAMEVRYTSFTDTTGLVTDFQYGRTDKAADDYNTLIVYKNSVRQYTFTTNFQTKTITLPSPLGAADVLHVYAYGQTGEKMVGEYTYTGDGTTKSFVLSNIPSLTQQSLVYVDGVETAVTVTEQDGRSLITFSTAPSDGAFIHVTTYNQATSRDAPTKYKLQTTTMTAGTNTYSLDNTVNFAQPFSANTIVEIDGIRLRPANSKYYTGDGFTTQFNISITAGETTIVNPSDIGVAVINSAADTTLNYSADNVAITADEIAETADAQGRFAVIQQSTNTTLNAINNEDYTITTAGYSADNSAFTADNVINTADTEGRLFVTMITAPADGDKVIVYNRSESQYTISADGTEILIDGSVSFTSSSVLRINTFANHDPLRIQTKVFKGQGTGSTTVLDEFDTVNFDTAGFDRSVVSGTVGTYDLDRIVTNVNNFWVTVDGVRLHPGDYITVGSSIVMSNAIKATIGGASVVVITHISENQIQPSVGFRIFKDMNDNVEYLRMCKDATTEIKTKAVVRDTKIYVDDASVLAQVDGDSEYPGVVFIGGERITYWEINTTDNYISSLRRGTLGTAVVQLIRPGFLVVDGGRDQYLPASNTHTNVWYNMSVSAADSTVLLSDSTVVFASATGQANGLGIQQSTTINANFLKACEAQVPNYRLELNDRYFVQPGYAAADYIEVLP